MFNYFDGVIRFKVEIVLSKHELQYRCLHSFIKYTSILTVTQDTKKTHN